MLKSMGKRLIFVTNNSTKSRAGYLKKFHSLGLTQVTAVSDSLSLSLVRLSCRLLWM
jgi:ribonucleotide monophosphatase NagD (HAD superfamily)